MCFLNTYFKMNKKYVLVFYSQDVEDGEKLYVSEDVFEVYKAFLKSLNKVRVKPTPKIKTCFSQEYVAEKYEKHPDLIFEADYDIIEHYDDSCIDVISCKEYVWEIREYLSDYKEN